MFQNSSKIFSGYRALGVNSDHVPCVIRYNRKHQETYVITSIGKAFHVYKCSNLGLVRVSDTLEDDINCLACDEFFIYAASKNDIYAFKMGRKICKKYIGHKSNVNIIYPFSTQLISVDESNELKIWSIETQEIYLSLNFDLNLFEISCLMHPITYLNKILFGSKQGSMQLWNIKTAKQIYSFKSFNSPITLLQQAPAVDVIGVGLENGKIIIHNIKFDETIMSFSQDWGPITTLSFRTDGNPIMISGSTLGHMAIWNLEDKRLISQIREAHMGSVSGMHTFELEPLMITSSNDNSVKIWIFDMPDGSARLLRQRHGHHSSPIKIRFHGQNGENILSSGLDSCLMSFSIDHDGKNKSLGRASFNKIETRKSGLKLDEHKMPPIIDFDSNETKQSDWDSIICIHQGLRLATTWDYIKSTMGKYKIDNERFGSSGSTIISTCCTITSCGNFCVIGYSSGHVDLYNMQSGQFRATYGESTAHDCSIRGVAVDALNRITISASENGDLTFWQFKNKHFSTKNLNVTNYFNKIKLDEPINQILLHRESGMLAVSLDDFTVLVVDCDIQKIVRKFSGHFNRISDICFSNDARWLFTASMDCMIKIWDLPSSKLIDCILFENAPTSICLSPTSEFLATTHVNQIGVYLWSNRTLYSHVALRQLPNDYIPQCIKMPSTNVTVLNKNGQKEEEEGVEEVEDEDDYKNYQSPEQISYKLVTLSLLPDSRWKNLVNLDTIRQRNKPKEAPKVPKMAPFFLPTISDVNGFKFDLSNENGQNDNKMKSKISTFTSINMFLSEFGNSILKSENPQDYEKILDKFKIMGPSAIDVEIRSMSIDMGGTVELMNKFLHFLLHVFKSNKNFELANSYLALFIKIHAETIGENDQLIQVLIEIKNIQFEVWNNIKINLNKNICLINYIKNTT